MFLTSKCQGEWDLGLFCPALAKIMRLHSADFQQILRFKQPVWLENSSEFGTRCCILFKYWKSAQT